MTPVLLGRWQSRLFLTWTAGLIVALLFGALYDRLPETLVMLVYVTLVGMLLDILYDRLQRLRWENDWPPSFHVGTGILEGLVIWILMLHPIFWDQLPGMTRAVTSGQFFSMY